MANTYVYDIETLCNTFTYTAIEREGEDKVYYIIWNDINQLDDLIEHLNSVWGLIGFNNLNFDYPVLHYILKNQNYLRGLRTEDIAREIYAEAQRVIKQEYSAINENEVLIPQLDLFKIWHYDNKARMTSLKKLEIAMEFNNVQDMPIHHSAEITDIEQVIEVLKYNENDVQATLKFYQLTKDKIELRKGLLKDYQLPCLNYSDSKIGEQLMLKLYCQKTGKDENVVRKQRTFRKIFKFKDCIPSYIKFETKEFNDLLDYLKPIEVNTLKDSFSYTFTGFGLELVLGTGGLHHCIKSGIYEADENTIIVDDDVASLYPNLAIVNKFYPKHLGQEFTEVYEKDIVIPRLEAKRAGNKIMADGFKLSANSCYGKSNSEYSYLYDPLYTLQTTLYGQLSLCMLTEMILQRIPNVKILQVNTDGITSMFDKQYKAIYDTIRVEWMETTKLELEEVLYAKMIIRDVNSYIGLYTNGKAKYKGTFKTNEEMRKDGEYHKSFSQGIVSVALSEFYLKGISVEETINKCTNIYEFCKTGNTTGQWKAETFELDEEGKEINKLPQQKTTRYYLSTDGVRFRKYIYKESKTDNEELVYSATEYEAEKKITVFNQYVEKPFNEYNVDYGYYINECYKIIHKLDGTEDRNEQERKERIALEKRNREEENFVKFCVSKQPTKRQLELYTKGWLIEKYGEVTPK